MTLVAWTHWGGAPFNFRKTPADARVEPAREADAARNRCFVELPEVRHYFEPDFGEREVHQVAALMDLVVA